MLRNRLIGAMCITMIFMFACNLARDALTPPVPTVPIPSTVEALPVLSEYLTDPRVTSYDPFDNAANWTFQSETGAFANGMFQMRGTPGWKSSLLFKQTFGEGQALTIRFKVQNAGGRAEFVLVSGEWLADSFRQFGVYAGAKPETDLFQGRNDLGGGDLISNLTIRPDTWYDVLLAVGHDGHLLAVLWDPANTTQRAGYNLPAGGDWAGRTWQFLPKANDGETVTVDDFYRISFGEIR